MRPQLFELPAYTSVVDRRSDARRRAANQGPHRLRTPPEPVCPVRWRECRLHRGLFGSLSGTALVTSALTTPVRRSISASKQPRRCRARRPIAAAGRSAHTENCAPASETPSVEPKRATTARFRAGVTAGDSRTFFSSARSTATGRRKLRNSVLACSTSVPDFAVEHGIGERARISGGNRLRHLSSASPFLFRRDPSRMPSPNPTCSDAPSLALICSSASFRARSAASAFKSWLAVLAADAISASA